MDKIKKPEQIKQPKRPKQIKQTPVSRALRGFADRSGGQQNAAVLVGVHLGTFNRWARGRHAPARYFREKLAALGVRLP